MSHTQPSGGYSSSSKRHYRREVWAFIERGLRDSACLQFEDVGVSAQCAERRVLVLESPQGGEVEELLRRGYTSSRIHVVNDSPAVVATVQRSYRHDRRMRGLLQTHGTSLDAAFDEFQRQGLKFDAMNLDFTSCFSNELDVTIRHGAALMKPGGVLVVTVQRGRERGTLGEFITSPGRDNDPHRADALRVVLIARAASSGSFPADQNGCQWHFAHSKWGVYRGDNSRVSMLWVGMQLVPHAWPGYTLFWRTLDLFGPWCGIEAIGRNGLQPSEQLAMEYTYVNGRGQRRFFHFNGDAKTFDRYMEGRFSSVHSYVFNRPPLLEQWASRRPQRSRDD